ncbi:hypothetical protein K474DRAFT_1660848 [Panus rudis PR-1116 ss-1]|nr:hypothetical protein K474DRAFT_1660848 [Panus rudis PR-1116 ss-1]
MPPIESPLNAAHQHAANAEDFSAQGLLIPASEEHHKAAEAFKACIEASSDENTKRTLRMLYNEHNKAEKELQRKIAKLREENKDPSIPQKSSRPAPSSSSVSPSVVPPRTPATPPPNAPSSLSDSQQMVDESFLLLAQRSEGGDAFNHFWRITEGMLEHLSQPVAFAIAPLGPPENGPSTPRRRETNSSSDTDVEDPITRTLSRGVGLVKAASSKMLTRNDSYCESAGVTTFPPKPQSVAPIDDWDDDIFTEDDHMSESFFVIPSKSDPPVAVLKKENATLKSKLEEMQKQLAMADQALKQRKEQDQQLRDSIMLARKEAQRAMTSSMALRQPPPPVDLASLTINPPPVPVPVPIPSPAPIVNPGRDKEAQLLKRVRELEEELRAARIENEKHKAMIVKFRERWEKLKESSKRKKQAKMAAEAAAMAEHNRIEEEPEAEAQAERDDLREGGAGAAL